MNARVSCPGRGRQEGWEAASKPLSSVYCAFVPRRSWGLPRPPQPQVRRPGAGKGATLIGYGDSHSGFERAFALNAMVL